MADRLDPVRRVVGAGHLHVVEGNVLPGHVQGQLLRPLDQPVLGAAIEIDVGQILFRDLLDQRERVVRVGLLRGREHRAPRRPFLLAAEAVDADQGVRLPAAGRLLGRRGALRPRLQLAPHPRRRLPSVLEGPAGAADGDEHVGVPEAHRDRAEAAHRQAGHGAALAAGDGPEVPVDVVDDVPNDVVLPVVRLPVLALRPVDVPRVPGVGHHDDEVAVEAGVERGAVRQSPRGVVLRQAVQQIQHRIARGRRLVVVRKEDVVLHGAVDGGAEELDRLQVPSQGRRRGHQRPEHEYRRRRPHEPRSQHAVPPERLLRRADGAAAEGHATPKRTPGEARAACSFLRSGWPREARP